MNKLKQECIKADIEILKKRKHKLEGRIKKINVTLQGVNYKIKNLEKIITVL